MIYKSLNEEVIIQEETFPLLEEAVNKLTFTPKDQVPKDFPETVSSIMEKIETELDKKVGVGMADATFGRLKISLGNAKKRILNKEPKNSYPIIIPTKGSEDSKVNSAVEKAITSSGFKKGGKLAEGWNGYYYKKGKDKSIYACGWWKTLGQIQIQIICCIDNKDNMDFIKANHNNSAKNESVNIFSDIEFLSNK